MNRRRLLILGLTLLALFGAGLVVGGRLRAGSLIDAYVATNPHASEDRLTIDMAHAAVVSGAGVAMCAVGIIGIGLLALHDWKRRRTRTDACRQCGYARSGWATDRCPECGAVGGVAGGVASKA